MSKNPDPNAIHSDIASMTMQSEWSVSMTGFYREQEVKLRISNVPDDENDSPGDIHISMYTEDGEMAATMFLSEGVEELFIMATQAKEIVEIAENDVDDDDIVLLDDDDDDGEDDDDDEDDDLEPEGHEDDEANYNDHLDPEPEENQERVDWPERGSGEEE